jgi:hypothetical protein
MYRSDAYFAGLFDGEASVGVYGVTNGRNTKSAGKKYWAVRLCIAMTHKPTLDACLEHFNVGTVTTQKRQSSNVKGIEYIANVNCKQGWRWIVTNKRDVEMVLDRLLPHLIEKYEQAELALAYCRGEIEGELACIKLKDAKRFNYSNP